MRRNKITKKKVYDLAEKLGVTVTNKRYGSYGWDITADAPRGFVFSGCDLHTLVANSDNETIPKADLWADIYSRMECGVEKCEEIDCDICDGQG